VKKYEDMKIGIFCSASENIDSIYFEETQKLGTWIGRNRHTIVYGGTSQGLMECIAKSVNESGGDTIGIMPSFMYENGLASSEANNIVLTQDMTERKERMMNEADIFIALPGGFGTYDEIFHIVACGQVGYHSKKVLLFNINGFYDDLVRQSEKCFNEKFTPIEYKSRLKAVYSIDECINELLQLPI